LIPSYLAIFDFISLAPAVGLGYYAFKMVFLSRRGRLENGWRLITFGAIMFSVGFFSLTIQDLTAAYTVPYFVTDYLGTSFSFVGLTLLMLGLRSHYSVWSLKSFAKVSKMRDRVYENASEEA
jgi:hypothetical protein